MNILEYLNPAEDVILPISSDEPKRMGNIIAKHTTEHGFPDLTDIDIAIMGVDEDRMSVGNSGCALASNSFRDYFYRLFPVNSHLKVADIGNVIKGNAPDDTYFALKSIVYELIEQNIIPIIIGGGQELTYAMYQAYKTKKQIINIVSIDNMFDLGNNEQPLTSRSFLSHILMNKPNFLFNYTNIGYQTYFVDQAAIDLMKNLYFETYRLGIFKNNIMLTEPLLRNADMITFDISAIRQSDAPGNANATPNGFYGEDACQMARYAGSSENVSSIGFFEFNPQLDRNGQTSHLLAQMVWYFIDGFYQRLHEQPSIDNEDFIRYNVQLDMHSEGIVFYKSKRTERWWMEIKRPNGIKDEFRRHFIIPCSHVDYEIAMTNEVPDRWWQAFQKLM